MSNLIIKNATVIDSIEKTSQIKDLYIDDKGIFVDKINDQEAQIIDAKGLFVAPAFIDMHVHVFENKTQLGIRADTIGINQGVLKVVDAGSVGISDFGYFKKETIQNNKTQVLYFLNIAKKGLCGGLSELSDLNDLTSPQELASFIENEGEGLVGLKVRLSGSVVCESGIKPLIHARNLSDKTGLPLMIHIGNAPPKLGEILDLLKSGDIVTHCFHGKIGGVPYFPKEYIKALERGVHFDVGHGSASFSFETVPKVLKIKDTDYSISTDLYNANYQKPVKSLMTTMSKFFPFGLEIEQLVNKVTQIPRSVLKIKSKNNLKIGEQADLTIFSIQNESLTYTDSEGFSIQTDKHIQAQYSIIKGKVVWQNGI